MNFDFKSILALNKRIYVQVCEGDTIVVDVKNKMGGRSTTIHWHGIRQVTTPWMDGVPMVTQCPIDECQIFRYMFLADDPGLDFYHSHDGNYTTSPHAFSNNFESGQ